MRVLSFGVEEFDLFALYDLCFKRQVADVKKIMETTEGDVYPATQQMLIHQGKVLKDTTTLEENKVAENSFIVIMLSKSKVSPCGTSSTQGAATSQVFFWCLGAAYLASGATFFWLNRS